MNGFYILVKKSISPEFRLKNIEEIKKNISLKKIDQNELMSKKHKNVCTTLNYIEQFLILASVITGVFQFLLLVL